MVPVGVRNVSHAVIVISIRHSSSVIVIICPTIINASSIISVRHRSSVRVISVRHLSSSGHDHKRPPNHTSVLNPSSSAVRSVASAISRASSVRCAIGNLPPLYICDNTNWTIIHMLRCVGSERVSACMWSR